MIWKGEYATGIRNIDHQHKEIVEIVTNYETLSEHGASHHELHRLLSRTKEFMAFHFSVEESLMRLLPYPDSDAHRAEHQRQLQQIADIERQLRRGSRHVGVAALMRDCLCGHIVSGDRRFAHFALRLFGQHGARKSKGDTALRVAVRRE